MFGYISKREHDAVVAEKDAEIAEVRALAISLEANASKSQTLCAELLDKLEDCKRNQGLTEIDADNLAREVARLTVRLAPFTAQRARNERGHFLPNGRG